MDCRGVSYPDHRAWHLFGGWLNLRGTGGNIDERAILMPASKPCQSLLNWMREILGLPTLRFPIRWQSKKQYIQECPYNVHGAAWF